MKYHPDRNPDDTDAIEKFKEAKEAFEILKDPQKRAAYDQFGHAGVSNQAGGGGGAGFGGADINDIFGDVFGDIFGGGGRSRGGGPRVYRGDDLQYNLEINLEEAVAGVTTEIKLPSSVACDACDGSGSKREPPGQLPYRHGVGQVRHATGFLLLFSTCHRAEARVKSHYRPVPQNAWPCPFQQREKALRFKFQQVSIPAIRFVCRVKVRWERTVDHQVIYTLP
ncbi:UNVERIFIED_CONTAM: hypothetical protein GTU68_038796 [Idotea baltica]|nr:hypothetical protein [Idotea baltica]